MLLFKATNCKFSGLFSEIFFMMAEMSVASYLEQVSN